MTFTIVGAIVSGIVGTLIMSVLMGMAPRMGMPEMDIVGMLGAMFSKDSNRGLGWVMHLMLGVIFAVIYAALWSAGLLVGGSAIVTGIVFGIVHWLVVGVMMGVMPLMHAGIKAGTVDTPGFYMLNNGGMMSFMGGLMGHALFGLIVGFVYGLF